MDEDYAMSSGEDEDYEDIVSRLESIAEELVVRLSQSERYLLFLSEVSDTSTDLDGRPLYITLNDSNGVLEFNGKKMQPNEFVLGVTQTEAQEELAELPTAAESVEHEVHAVLAALDEVRD